MRYAFAGDRDISVEILNFLISQGYKPLALIVTEKSKASHADQLIQLSGLNEALVFEGNQFKNADKLLTLQNLDLDYIIGIHFPYIIPKSVLDVPKIGFLNLHPAYLPFNKGWHTPSWAILEGTPYGATLHFMSEELDNGDIIYQKECAVLPSDTANSLYQRVKQMEIETFKEAFPYLITLTPPRNRQIVQGTAHLKKDLKNKQMLEMNNSVVVKDLIDQLRGLTTNKVEEAAFFIENGKKYFIQVSITEKD